MHKAKSLDNHSFQPLQIWQHIKQTLDIEKVNGLIHYVNIFFPVEELILMSLHVKRKRGEILIKKKTG